MRFWDTSAIVPLCVDEPSSAMVKAIFKEGSSLVVWWATQTECVSALGGLGHIVLAVILETRSEKSKNSRPDPNFPLIPFAQKMSEVL